MKMLRTWSTRDTLWCNVNDFFSIYHYSNLHQHPLICSNLVPAWKNLIYLFCLPNPNKGGLHLHLLVYSNFGPRMKESNLAKIVNCIKNRNAILLIDRKRNYIKSSWLSSSQQREFNLPLSWRFYNCKREIFSKEGKNKKGNGGNEWFPMFVSSSSSLCLFL